MSWRLINGITFLWQIIKKLFRRLFYSAPGLAQKRPDFNFDAEIGETQTYPWNPQLSHAQVNGTPFYNEVVFFHPFSRTLILTDLAVHICESNSFFTRLWLKLIGVYGKFGWAKIEKKIFIRNSSAFQKSIAKISDWDFDKIIVAHGRLIHSAGKNYFNQAFELN